MPLHDYRCPTCGSRREVFTKIVDLDKTEVYCRKCDQPMLRQLSAPYIQCDYQAYESPVVPGKIIEGRRAHEEHLKETGCRLLEPGESDAYRTKLKRADETLERHLEETADRLIAEMPTEKRDRLAAEMEGGLTTTIERSTPTFKT